MTLPQSDIFESSKTLEGFLAEALHRGGAWDSPRTSDGLSDWRVVEQSPGRLRLKGQIWEIRQAQVPFWLDLETGGAGELRWRLYFGILPGRRSLRQAALAIDAIDRPEQAAWRFCPSGDARIEDGLLKLRSVERDPQTDPS